MNISQYSENWNMHKVEIIPYNFTVMATQNHTIEFLAWINKMQLPWVSLPLNRVQIQLFIFIFIYACHGWCPYKGNQHDINFAPPENGFNIIFTDEGKYDKERYALRDKLATNPHFLFLMIKCMINKLGLSMKMITHRLLLMILLSITIQTGSYSTHSRHQIF